MHVFKVDGITVLGSEMCNRIPASHINDVKVFNGKVGQSLKEPKGKRFNPKNTGI